VPAKLVQANVTVKLNLGCGTDIRSKDEGWVNLDIADGPGVDIVHDLDDAPWPFSIATFDEVAAYDIFEHVEDPITFMVQAWRVLKWGGVLTLRTTHWREKNAYTDPTHKRFPTEETFDYWIAGTVLHSRHNNAYGGVSFQGKSYQRVGQEQEFTLVKINIHGCAT
jgi:SAM-dependent methyltransferase